MANCRFNSDGQSGIHVRRYSVAANLVNLQVQNPYSAGVAVGGTSSIYGRESKDTVVLNPSVVGVGVARGVVEASATNGSFIPDMRFECHGYRDPIGLVASSSINHNIAISLHGMQADCIYWDTRTARKGVGFMGWKCDWRWGVFGTHVATHGHAWVNLEDGTGDCWARDLHFHNTGAGFWFWKFESAPMMHKRTHFRNITHLNAPTRFHNVGYGTGADACTYQSGTIDDPHASWITV